MCPKCLKRSKCGCNSCLSRDKGKMSTMRSKKFSGDFVTCPYCRTKFHYDQWSSFSYELYDIKRVVADFKELMIHAGEKEEGSK